MKRIILLAALAALVMGCEKYASDKPESSGIYLDGERVVSIGSVYWGSHNDDSRGRTFHFELYEDGFESGAYPPRFSPCVAAVYGLRETGVSYSAHGYLDHLYIPDIANLGTGLTIPLLQGEYKGGCSVYRYTDETLFGYYRDVITTLESEGMGWILGPGDGTWGLRNIYPAVEDTEYEKIDEDDNPLNIYVTGPEVVNKRRMYNYDYIGQLTMMYSTKHFGLIQINCLCANTAVLCPNTALFPPHSSVPQTVLSSTVLVAVS